MGNFMSINAFNGNPFIESGFLLKKNEYSRIFDLFKERFCLLHSEQNISKENALLHPAKDKIFI